MYELALLVSGSIISAIGFAVLCFKSKCAPNPPQNNVIEGERLIIRRYKRPKSEKPKSENKEPEESTKYIQEPGKPKAYTRAWKLIQEHRQGFDDAPLEKRVNDLRKAHKL